MESPEHAALPCSLAICEPDSVSVPVGRGWPLGPSVQAGCRESKGMLNV